MSISFILISKTKEDDHDKKMITRLVELLRRR